MEKNIGHNVRPFLVSRGLFTHARMVGSFLPLTQGGAEPTDTFQMVIDNIWKQGKICETICKYVQTCYLLPTDYKFIF